jgi:hypothetical protein
VLIRPKAVRASVIFMPGDGLDGEMVGLAASFR